MDYKDATEQKYIATLAFAVLKGLFNEPDGKDILKKVFLTSFLTPQDILMQAKKMQLRAGNPKTAIYEDIQYALYVEMRDNEDSRVVSAIYDCANQYLKRTGRLKELKSFMRAISEGMDPPYGYGDDATFSLTYFFLLYDKIPLGPVMQRCLLSQYKLLQQNFRPDSEEVDMRFLGNYYLDDGTPITESATYHRLVDEITGKLTEYLGRRYPAEKVSTENLHQIIAKRVHCSFHFNPKTRDLDVDKLAYRDDAILASITWVGVENYHFSHDMIINIMSNLSCGLLQTPDYHPNINTLIDLAIQSHIRPYFQASLQKRLTRIVLRKEIAPRILDNIEAFYDNVVSLYYADCLYKALELYRDEYYVSFPWFYDVEKEDAPRVTPVLNLLPKEKKGDTDAYAELNDKYAYERKRVIEISKRHTHELAEKDRIIDARTDELASLQRQLQLQQEYIDLLNAAEEPAVEEQADISRLYGKRFLFVGQLLESYSALRKTFPNSVFMESETASIKSLKVDGVVLLIRNMSHSMYYKVMQNSQLAELPRIYCNSRNINNVYQAMIKGMH